MPQKKKTIAKRAPKPKPIEGRITARCMKCQTNRVMADAVEVKTAHGSGRAAQGFCPKCDTKMFKFLPREG